MKAVVFGAVVMALCLAACGCGEGGGDEKQVQSPAELAAALDQGPRAVETLKLDPVLAERGKSLFDEKSCTDCHVLGEADIGPDLLGVLDRRTHKWLMKQINDPEWMGQHDTITKGLIDQFDMEMADMEASEADAEAILHYLLRESGNTPR